MASLFNFERNYTVLKLKSSCFLLDKNINFNKNKTGSKMENPTHSFREAVFSSCKNRELKVKLMIWSSPKKKECIFCNVYFVRRKFMFYLNL